MVWKLNCECEDRREATIGSVKVFEEIKMFFDEQVQKQIFIEEVPKQPYYIGRDEEGVMAWFATKWYRCNICGCLWEINYPDFPANGFVRKFKDGNYVERGY